MHVIAFRLDHLLRFQERPVPDIQPGIVGLQPRPRKPRQDFGNGDAVRHRREILAPPDMQHVHGRRIALLHFQRADVQLILMAVDIVEQLGGVDDRRGGVERMMAAQQGEIGHRFQIVQIRAGQHEEIAQHLVAVPVGDQIGQAVEHVVGPASGLFDGFVNDGQERLEAIAGIEHLHFHPRPFRHQRRMASEMEIHQLAAPGAGVLAERFNQRHVIINAIHLPDDVIACHDPPEHPVQARQPRAHLCVNRRHHILPFTSVVSDQWPLFTVLFFMLFESCRCGSSPRGRNHNPYEGWSSRPPASSVILPMFRIAGIDFTA